METSSESQIRQALNQEATISDSFSLSVGGGISVFGKNNILGGLNAKVSTSYSFSESSRFERIRNTNIARNFVSFESRAVCSEFEGSFNPYAKHELDPIFKEALNGLSVPYDPSKQRDKDLYEKFFNTYGINYVRSVVLGGKRIYSTSMSSKDYSSLVRDSVDVESTMSFEVSGGISGSAASRGMLGGDDKCCDSDSKNSADEKEEENGLFSFNANADSKYNIARYARNKRQAEAALKISEKDIETSETTIGGLPSADWREWAKTVKQKPMPIKYELGSIMEFMDIQQSTAFVDAFEDIFRINLGENVADSLLQSNVFRTAVINGRGDPLSSSSANPNSKYRALIQVGNIPNQQELNPDDGIDSFTRWIGFERGYDPPSLFKETTYFPGFSEGKNMGACGMRVKHPSDIAAADDIGIASVYLKFCDVKDWSIKSPWVEISGRSQLSFPIDEDVETAFTEEHCEHNTFINGVRIRFCGNQGVEGDWDNGCEQGSNNLQDDLLGIHGINFFCKELGANDESKKEMEVYCQSRKASNDKDYCDTLNTWELPEYVQASEAGKSAIIVGGQVSYETTDVQDNIGLDGIKLFYGEINVSFLGKGNADDIITYTATWQGMFNRPYAIFATPIHLNVGRDEDEEDDLGFIAGQYKNNVPFAISRETNALNSIAVTNFDRSIVDGSSLESFTFLSASNVESYLGKIISGVIRYDSLILDDERDLAAVRVSRKKNKKFSVTFNEPYASHPTIAIFQNWYTEGEFYPQDIADISCSLSHDFDENGFKVTYGSTGFISRTYLGFNYLAIGPDQPTDNVKHGIIYPTSDCTNSLVYGVPVAGLQTTLHGLKDPECIDGNVENIGGMVAYAGGVLIKFDKPFTSLPSVILTPIYGGDVSGSLVPRCIIESLTKEEVFVKCALIQGGNSYSWLPFTLVAVGPS